MNFIGLIALNNSLKHFCFLINDFNMKHNKIISLKHSEYCVASSFLILPLYSRLICCIIFSYVPIDIFVSYKQKKISQHVREFLIVCNRSCFPSVLKCSKYDHIQNFMTNVQKNQCPFQVLELMVIEKCSNNLSQYLVDQTTISHE